MKAYALRSQGQGRSARIVATLAVSVSAAALVAMGADGAAAQSSNVPEITIVKPPGGYGAYGQNLPGVYMTTGSGISTGPEPGSPTPAYSWVDPMPELTYDQNPVGWVDGWHGGVGNGIPF
ncbi:hypothetical protein RUR49_15545 [Pseudoxanthobacter sp. M-2]|uniref:hypothetical protein n=1 Tax=Pseudoxanthobacter sp. M-2 TaxID=3078754 RepID=UPI0038FD3CFB